MTIFSEKVKRERKPVGIGFCDICLIRVFMDEDYLLKEDGQLICPDCLEELEDDSHYQGSGDRCKHRGGA